MCVNAEMFTQQGAADYFATVAKTTQERLGDISQALGISFPVYVLFTRCDRLPFFADYVRSLTNEEAGQVLGVTLPMRNVQAGVYAEEETRRLVGAFDSLFYSLADKRLLFLPRESDPQKIPGAYEFPREFRKLRNAVVQFLVDVARPSQLRTSPFLRGFYFTGVRPVTVQDTPLPTARPLLPLRPRLRATLPACSRPCDRAPLPSLQPLRHTAGPSAFHSGCLRPASSIR